MVAWAVVQVLDTVFPALNVPEWAISMVVVLLTVGFPIAMVTAWMILGIAKRKALLRIGFT